MTQSAITEETSKQDRVTVVWLFSTVMISVTILFCLSRSYMLSADQLVNDDLHLLRALVMGLAICWASFLPERFLGRLSNEIRFVLLVSLLFAPWILFRILPEASARLVTDVLLLFMMATGMFAGLQFVKPFALVPATLFGIVLALALFTVTMGKGYISPFAYENAIAGLQHRDTLYHAAVAGMIEYHDTTSVGLDGLKPVFYHALYHRFFGSIATWLDAPLITSSSLSISIIILPLMFLTFCEVARGLRPQGWSPLTYLAGVIFLLSWPLLFSLLQPSPYFSSESYIFSLMVMFAVIPVMLNWEVSQGDPKVRIFQAAGFALAIFLAASAKISTGAILAAGLSSFVVLAGRFSVMSFIVALVAIVTPFLLVFLLSHGAGEDTSGIISPFHFLSEWPQVALFHIILTALTGLVVIKYADWETVSGRVFVGLFVTALAALGSSMLVKLPAGAAMFFANPGMWICILLLVVLLPAPKWAEGKSPSVQFAIALMVFTAIAGVEKERWQALKSLKAENTFPSSKASQQNSKLIVQINNAVEKNGRSFFVFVSPQFHDFWSQNDICWAQSFVVPGLTGQPMLKGLPPKESGCDITQYYGFSAYDVESSSSINMIDTDLCTSASENGFPAVLKFESLEGRFVRCTN